MDDSVTSFLSSYRSTLDQAIHLPARISDQYELYDCLHTTDTKSTYLIRNKSDNMLAVLKVAEKHARCDLKAEYQILEALHSPTFPQAICFLTDDQTEYFIRSYIAGYPVSYYVEKYGPFSETEAMRLIIGLCQPLQLLHEHTPPIIHRDIKPQNVIFTPERKLALIDFDTVRHYQADHSKDTTFLGTEITAAPEQFGYKQTDQRSDIYSTGVLLLFLCTGSYELEAGASIQNHKLARIIRACTRFDPDRRFSNIGQLRIHLEKALRDEKRSRFSFLRGSFVGLSAGLGLAFVLYAAGVIPSERSVTPATAPIQMTATPLSDEEAGAIVFISPQIEQAVRDQLGFDADTPIHQDDLDRITSLMLYGSEVLTGWNTVQNAPDSSKGSIISLSDIPKLRNLSDLALCNQNISDITPLSGMQIVRLALGGNQISDISAVADLPYLAELYIGNNPVARIDALRECNCLRILDLGGTTVVDLSPLSGGQLDSLYLNNASLGNYDTLWGMTSLNRLSLSSISQEELEKVPSLTGLTYFEYRGALSDISPLYRLTELTGMMCFDDHISSLEGIESLKNLSYLLIAGSPELDLSPLVKLPRLTQLDIRQQNYNDYSPLVQLKHLVILYCSAQQKDAILKLWPEAGWEFRVY